jgi:hypothetical protein
MSVVNVLNQTLNHGVKVSVTVKVKEKIVTESAVEISVLMFVVSVTDPVLLHHTVIVKITPEIAPVNAVELVKLTIVVFAAEQENQKKLVTVLVKY